MSCEVNRVPRPVACDGRYARVVGVASGDTVTFDFPIADRAVNVTIGAVDYSLVVRGNTVTSISPAGENSPFYTENA